LPNNESDWKNIAADFYETGISPTALGLLTENI